MLNQIKVSYKRILLINMVLLISLLASIYIAFYTTKPGYELLFIMPLVYCFCFIWVFSRLFEGEFKVFFFMFSALTFLRYVVLPFMLVFSGYYDGRSRLPPEESSYFQAILLMVYELLLASALIKFLETNRTVQKKLLKSRSNKLKTQFETNKSYTFYWIFGGIVLTLSTITPGVFQSINFLTPSQNVVRDFSEIGTLQSLLIYGIVIFKQLVFVIICLHLYKKFERSKKFKYIFYASVLSVINISIYFGTNRSTIIITAIASLMLLYKLFGKRIKSVIIVIAVLLVILISSISAIRGGATVSDDKKVHYTDVLQTYLGGPYNVSIAIETKEYFPESSNLEVLFFDIFRPMIGVNLLIKDLPIEYSNVYFNDRMWIHVDRRSQILPMVGQGNLFFGPLLSPIFTLIFIVLAYYLYIIVNNTKRIEIYYFLTLILTRLAFMTGQNTMNMINFISLNLLLFLIIFTVNNLLFNSKKRKGSLKNLSLNKEGYKNG